MYARTDKVNLDVKETIFIQVTHEGAFFVKKTRTLQKKVSGGFVILVITTEWV